MWVCMCVCDHLTIGDYNHPQTEVLVVFTSLSDSPRHVTPHKCTTSTRRANSDRHERVAHGINTTADEPSYVDGRNWSSRHCFRPANYLQLSLKAPDYSATSDITIGVPVRRRRLLSGPLLPVHLYRPEARPRRADLRPQTVVLHQPRSDVRNASGEFLLLIDRH